MRSAALKSSDFLRPDDDFILTEFAFEPFTQGPPENVFNIVGHDFDHGDAVMLRFAVAFPQALGRARIKLVAPPNFSVSSFRRPLNHCCRIGSPVPVSFGRSI